MSTNPFFPRTNIFVIYTKLKQLCEFKFMAWTEIWKPSLNYQKQFLIILVAKNNFKTSYGSNSSLVYIWGFTVIECLFRKIPKLEGSRQSRVQFCSNNMCNVSKIRPLFLKFEFWVKEDKMAGLKFFGSSLDVLHMERHWLLWDNFFTFGVTMYCSWTLGISL